MLRYASVGLCAREIGGIARLPPVVAHRHARAVHVGRAIGARIRSSGGEHARARLAVLLVLIDRDVGGDDRRLIRGTIERLSNLAPSADLPARAVRVRQPEPRPGAAIDILAKRPGQEDRQRELAVTRITQSIEERRARPAAAGGTRPVSTAVPPSW